MRKHKQKSSDSNFYINEIDYIIKNKNKSIYFI